MPKEILLIVESHLSSTLTQVTCASSHLLLLVESPKTSFGFTGAAMFLVNATGHDWTSEIIQIRSLLMTDENVSCSGKLNGSSWRGQWRTMFEVVEKEASSLRCCKVVYKICVSTRGKKNRLRLYFDRVLLTFTQCRRIDFISLSCLFTHFTPR